jgi:multimeric flavodoxin WrbA
VRGGALKVLGICCGRKNGNSEILVKEALMGAEDVGAEVEIVRLHDLDIRPCTGCNTCVLSLFRGGPGECVIDDDLPFIDERIMECDGLVLGAPVYERTPPGILKTLNDRMGPSHDVAMRLDAKRIREEVVPSTGTRPAQAFDCGPDERSFKPRAASLIAVGGSDCVTLALPVMQLFVQPLQMTIVDKLRFPWQAPPHVIVLNDAALARARLSGRHVAETMTRPMREARYIGEPGMCPVCHSSVLEMAGTLLSATCAACGVKGVLEIQGDEVRFVVTDEERKKSDLLLSGKFEHSELLRDIFAEFAARPDRDEIPRRLEKYRSYGAYSRPAGRHLQGMEEDD